jgi:hypothetical protein
MANLGNTVVNGKLTVSDEIDVNGTNVVETLNKKANTFSVSSTGNTLAWGTSTQIATVAGTAINVTMPSNPDTDLNTTYTLVQDSSDKHKIALKDNAGNVGTYVTIPDNNTTYTFSPANPTLSWGTKTSIGTAGGQTYYVTMPSNPNTDTHYTNYFAVSTLVGSTTTQVVKYVQNGDKTLTLVQGSNITLTPDATNSKITIAATNTVYTHPTYTATTAAAKKIGRDSTGHVVIGDSISASDVGAASSSHTHSLSLASGGTSSINLAANTTYTLTAGGSTYAFKTPADNNTTYSVATTSANGLMSSTDKTKLDGLDSSTYIKKSEEDYRSAESSSYPFNTRYIQGGGSHKSGAGGVGFAIYNNYASGDTLTDDYLIEHIKTGATSPSTKSDYDNYSGIVVDASNQGIYISSGNTSGSINLGAQYGGIKLNSNTSITGSLTGSSYGEFSGNLTANALKTTANNSCISFLTGSGTNFGVQGNANTVYDLNGMWEGIGKNRFSDGTHYIRKTHYVITCGERSSTSNYWKIYLGKILKIDPTNDDSNSEIVRISGTIGGFGAKSKIYIDGAIMTRDGFSGIGNIKGGDNASYESLFDNTYLIIDSSGNIYLYAKYNYPAIDLEMSGPSEFYDPAGSVDTSQVSSYSGTDVLGFGKQKMSTTPVSVLTPTFYGFQQYYVKIGSVSNSTSGTTSSDIQLYLYGRGKGRLYVIRAKASSTSTVLAVGSSTNQLYTDYDCIAYATNTASSSSWMTVTVYVPKGRCYYLYGNYFSNCYAQYWEI